jgi:hypothetical protein
LIIQLLPNRVVVSQSIGISSGIVSKQRSLRYSIAADRLPLTLATIITNHFLHELLKDNQRCYCVYQASFRYFLHRKDILQKTGLTIPGIHLLIAKDQLNKWKNRRRE